jgi:NMD protein affecting ribosome stability and mRNA decay
METMILERPAAPVPLTGWCVECGATTAGGNGSPLYESLCADCAEVWEDERAAAEHQAATAYAREDALSRTYRAVAVQAAGLHDWRAFFAAAALCAQAMNRREAISDAEVPARAA